MEDKGKLKNLKRVVKPKRNEEKENNRRKVLLIRDAAGPNDYLQSKYFYLIFNLLNKVCLYETQIHLGMIRINNHTQSI